MYSYVYACYVYNLIFFRLNENYLLEDGVCLPRSTIYEHYLDFCERELIQPVNAASFGKVTSSTISIFNNTCMSLFTILLYFTLLI